MNDQMQNYSRWEQDYQQPVGELAMLYHGFSDANVVSTNFHSKNLLIQGEKTLTNANVAGNMYTISSPEIANPITSPGKPKRRRSKGTPSQSTTFLNASITNFRALVQQHTGCHTTPSVQKGPITLCFSSSSSSYEASPYGHFSTSPSV
ncbi:hypothetical protein Pfo_012459 [Paulownia fortunei]|nr:hypothetical protein Pfo_012459 [Paulownia fortunei]